MSLEAHFNSFFAHFVHFARVGHPLYPPPNIAVWLTWVEQAFDLLERRDIEPLRQLIDSFEEQGLFKDNERSREQ